MATKNFFGGTKQLFDDAGAVLNGGKCYFYEPGTATLKNTYTDSDLGTANANPVILDSAGRANVWLDGNYKVTVKDSADNTIYTEDKINPTAAVSGGYADKSAVVISKTGAYAIATTDDGKLITATSGTWSLTTGSAASDYGDGFEFSFTNEGSGTITFNPNGAETINHGIGTSTTLTFGPGDSGLIRCDGTNWRARVFRPNTIALTGGTIDGVTIGGTTPPTVTNLGTVTTADINGGTIDGTVIGGTSPAAGSFTTVTTSGIVSVDDTTDSTSGTTGSIHTDGGIGVAKAVIVGTSLTATTSIITNTIAERTAASGVTIDSVLLKDAGVIATGGITFANEALANYDEGTFTPVFADASSGGNASTTILIGRYVRVGKLVTIFIKGANIDTTGLTAGNDAFIRALPFTPEPANTPLYSGGILAASLAFAGNLTPVVQNSGAWLTISETATGVAADSVLVSEFTTGVTDFWITSTYEID